MVLPRALPFVPRSNLIAGPQPFVSKNLALSALSRGHIGPCTLGFDLKPGPITT
jgi:hypothetical protein